MLNSDIQQKLKQLPIIINDLIQNNPKKHYHIITIKGEHHLSKLKIINEIKIVNSQINSTSNKKWYHHLDFLKNQLTITFYDNHDKSLYNEMPSSDVFDNIVDPDFIPDDICPF